MFSQRILWYGALAIIVESTSRSSPSRAASGCEHYDRCAGCQRTYRCVWVWESNSKKYYCAEPTEDRDESNSLGPNRPLQCWMFELGLSDMEAGLLILLILLVFFAIVFYCQTYGNESTASDPDLNETATPVYNGECGRHEGWTIESTGVDFEQGDGPLCRVNLLKHKTQNDSSN